MSGESGPMMAPKAFLVRKVVETLGLTYRLRREIGAERIDHHRRTGQPAIFSFWHNRIVYCSYYVRNEIVWKGYPVSVIISRSADGELIARAVRGWGVPSARGSSSRGGSRALRELVRYLQEGGRGVVTTPDGPRGPAYEVQPGTILLAQLSRAPIYPMSYAAERAWRLRSWDRFIVPKPFSRIATVVGAPVAVPSDADEAGREASRLELERALREADRQAKEALGPSGSGSPRGTSG